MRTPIFLLLLTCLISCSSYNYEQKQEKKPATVDYRKIYAVDGGRDRRMEKVRNRGCDDNSTDCGKPIGW